MVEPREDAFAPEPRDAAHAAGATARERAQEPRPPALDPSLPPAPNAERAARSRRLPSERLAPLRERTSSLGRPEEPGASNAASSNGQITPRYPPLSRRLGEEGLVVLNVHVRPSGRVDDVRVLRDPGHPRLVRAAIEAVRAATFTPATRNARPTASWLETPVRFVLE